MNDQCGLNKEQEDHIIGAFVLFFMRRASAFYMIKYNTAIHVLPQVPFTMNSVLQKAFLWCVLTAFLPSITGAKPLNTDGLRRYALMTEPLLPFKTLILNKISRVSVVIR